MREITFGASSAPTWKMICETSRLKAKPSRELHRDRVEFVVVVVSFSPVGPVEHDVGLGHELDAHHASVDRMLARIERGNPDTLVADIDQIAMLEGGAADVLVGKADEGNHDTDGADGNIQHRHLLDLDKPRIQVPGTREQHLFLQATTATMRDERLGILEVVVTRNDIAGDFAALNGTTVERRHDAYHVGFNPHDLEQFRRHTV